MFDPFSLAILAASAFMKMQANEDAAGQREALRRQMETYQKSKARETEAATETLLQKQTPKARAEELMQVTQDREQSLKGTVGAAQAFDAPQIAGKLSGDYESTQEANAARIAERTRRAIEQLSSIGAPGEQQQRFGLRFGRAAGTVDAANRASENVGRGYMTDISNVVPDPFLSLAGDVGMAVGGSMAGSDPNSIPWTGEGEPSPWDYEDAAAVGKTLRKPTIADRLKYGLGIFGTKGR